MSSANAQNGAIGASGLPLPRFVALDSGKVNVRTGPGKSYPIKWVFERNHLPVMIVDESEDWRRIEDHEGETGWVHKNLLAGQQTILVISQVGIMRRLPRHDAREVLRADQHVVGDLLECQPGWCFAEIAGQRGWMDQADIWGGISDRKRD